MLAFSNDYYGMIFRATQSVELFCAYEELELSYKAFSISLLDFIIVKQEYKQERTIVIMIKIIKVLFLFLVIYAIAFFITFLTTPLYFLTP